MSPNRPEDIHSEPQQSEQQGAILAQLSALESVRAPDSLHRAVEQLVGDATARPRNRRFGLPRPQPLHSGRTASSLRLRLAGAATVLAATIVTLVLVLGSGGPAAPTVLEASRVALAPATLPSPSENPHDSAKLDASVEGLAYPYWGGRRGWPAAGSRHDMLHGRAVTTVFYATSRGARIGYAIVAGRPLAEPSTGTTLTRGGMRFRVIDANGATVVTWREAGHTCILAGRGVPAAAMVRLVLS